MAKIAFEGVRKACGVIISDNVRHFSNANVCHDQQLGGPIHSAFLCKIMNRQPECGLKEGFQFRLVHPYGFCELRDGGRPMKLV
jgi:hypothetical protein